MRESPAFTPAAQCPGLSPWPAGGQHWGARAQDADQEWESCGWAKWEHAGCCGSLARQVGGRQGRGGSFLIWSPVVVVRDASIIPTFALVKSMEL